MCSQRICFLFVQTKGQTAKLNVRIPSWTFADGAGATLNDKDLGSISPGKIILLSNVQITIDLLKATSLPDLILWAGSFLSITKQWNSDDHLALRFPIRLRTEAIKGNL